MARAFIPERQSFRQEIDGKKTDLFVLRNRQGMQVAITNYGARIVSLLYPDDAGNERDVVVGFSSVEEYRKSSEPYYGATIGRFANRIARGRFMLDGKEYQLAVNNGPNHLHGGIRGFQYAVWDVLEENESGLTLSYRSADGEEGYPGNLQVRLRFHLSDEDGLRLDFEATADARTVLNLTNHAYFNLNGEGSGPVLGHLMKINAGKFTPVDETLIPTGAIEPVEGTPFDFRKETAVGERINAGHPQIRYGLGYDHNYVLERSGTGLDLAAEARGEESGIRLQVFTTEPGLQFYSGNFMKGENRFKGGQRDTFRTAFCLETQHFPDSPNQPQFPSTVLEAGQVFRSSTVFLFSNSRRSRQAGQEGSFS